MGGKRGEKQKKRGKKKKKKKKGVCFPLRIMMGCFGGKEGERRGGGEDVSLPVIAR